MRILRLASLSVGLLLVVAPAAAWAQDGRAAPGVWNDAYGKTDNQRANDLDAAAISRRGYGSVNQTTNVAGDLNNNTTNNGPQNTTVAYNAINSNSTTTTASGSGITVSVSTGQTSGTATQNADARSAIGSITTTNNCGGQNACPQR